jgi:hypothetical protein
VEDIKVALHIFGCVLIFGTGWRLLTYHLMAAPNVHLQHLGKGMSIQY